MNDEVLVVDDDVDIREGVRMILDLYGLHSHPVGNPHEALVEMSGPHPPAAVLLDMRMPSMSGEEFLEAMRTLGLLGRIPVIVLSGDTTARSAARLGGADAFLQKPVEVQELVQTLSRFVAQQQHASH